MIPFFVGIYAQIRRYRSATPETRNQLKWTMLGMIIMVIGVMLYYGVYAFSPSVFTINNSLTIITLELVRQFIQLILAVILPITCFMIAIFRYRLWSASPSSIVFWSIRHLSASSRSSISLALWSSGFLSAPSISPVYHPGHAPDSDHFPATTRKNSADR